MIIILSSPIASGASPVTKVDQEPDPPQPSMSTTYTVKGLSSRQRLVREVGDAVHTHRSGGQSEHEPICAACNRLAQLSTCTAAETLRQWRETCAQHLDIRCARHSTAYAYL